uniref:Uncharacterized protein n=1 Tax=Daucus carota subsp. sativus TaxID=79200 RepID=A0A161ZT78_DAUCS
MLVSTTLCSLHFFLAASPVVGIWFTALGINTMARNFAVMNQKNNGLRVESRQRNSQRVADCLPKEIYQRNTTVANVGAKTPAQLFQQNCDRIGDRFCNGTQSSSSGCY